MISLTLALALSAHASGPLSRMTVCADEIARWQAAQKTAVAVATTAAKPTPTLIPVPTTTAVAAPMPSR